MPRERRYQQYYEAVAERFDVLRLDGREEIAITVRHFLERRQPPGDVLELGCGTGRYGSAIRAAGFHVTGLDISPDQLSYARGLDARVLGSSTDVPLDSDSFDGCLLILMIHQLSTDERALTLQECARVLRPRGLVCIKTCSHRDLRDRPLDRYFPSALPLNLARYPSLESLKRELGTVGFSNVESTPTRSVTRVTVGRLIDSIDKMHNTTLRLIPKQEFISGARRLRSDLASRETFELLHPHTLVCATGPG